MNRSKLFASVAVAALMAAPVFAQTGSPPSSRPGTTAPSGTSTTNRATMPSDIGSMKVSELVGKSVYSANEERIGEVDDVVVSKTGGQPMAVIGVGGFLGIGEKKATAPIDQLKVQGDKIVGSGLSKDSLKQQAEYKADDYTKVDRNMVVGQAGSATGGMTAPSTGGTSTSPSGAPATGSGGTGTGSGGTGTMGGPSYTPPAGGSGSGSTGSGSPSGGGSSTQPPQQ